MNYIDKKIQEWEEEFTSENWAGERQLNMFCLSEMTAKTPIIGAESEIVTKHKSFLKQALEEQREETRKAIENLRGDRINIKTKEGTNEFTGDVITIPLDQEETRRLVKQATIDEILQIINEKIK